KKTVSILIVLVVLSAFKPLTPPDNQQPFKNGFIVNPISFEAQNIGLGAEMNFSSLPLPDEKLLPVEFQLADLTGYLIVVDRTDPNYKAIKKLLKGNN